MNSVATYCVLFSLCFTSISSSPEFGFRDIAGIFTSAPETKDQSTPAVSSTPSSRSGSSEAVGSTLFSRTTAISTIESTYKNWVGPFHKSPDTACYRESHIGKTCPLEFNSKMNTCWAQCPITYPVKCGMECIRQNDDCKMEILAKVVVVFQSVMALAIANLYGEFKLMSKVVQYGFRCAKEMAILVKNLNRYIRSLMLTNPQTPQAQVLAVLYHTDNIVFDVPITIASCMGIPVKPNIRIADKIVNTGELILREIVARGDSIVSSWGSFKAFMGRVLLGESIADLKDKDITSLKSALVSNTTCGYDMKRLADRTWMTVLALRRKNPQMSENELRVYMSKSNLVLKDIPIATNNCMPELIEESDEKTAYATRTTLRKTFSVIVEDLIKSGTSNNGSLLNAEEYAYKIADKAFSFYGVWDIKGITNVIGEYTQTICGPTKFIGEVDDGPVDKALGMTLKSEAFNGTTGVWAKEGDGKVSLTFQSSDTKDVTVNIISAGDKVDEVDVKAGGSATWSSNVTALGGKTLYLDRWRPGFLGLPGTGGGSMSLWVPRATENRGHLDLRVKLNVS